jgi:hypothetical protein
MKHAKILLAVILSLMLTACGIFRDIKHANIGSEFGKSTRDYNQLVRWNELESAASSFVSPSLQEKYRERIKDARTIRITDYRVMRMECDPIKGEGSAKMELDYYRPPSVKLNTVEDLQKWSYEGEENKRAWRLKSLLPEFR